MYSEDEIQNGADLVAGLTAGGFSRDSIRDRLSKVGMPDPLIELSIARFEVSLIDIHGASVLVSDSQREAWCGGPKDTDRFWPPMVERLKRALPDEAVKSIDGVTSGTLAQLPQPGTPGFAARGLVVGYVQSGKTTNFLALAAKAADVGYKLIVILSGVTNSLRDQTQERVDELLVGDSDHWYPLTHPGADFAVPGNGAALFANFDGAMVAVVKKNPARLRRLRDWIQQATNVAQHHAPLLLIDDEADQASVDTGDGSRRTTINRLLREILAHPRSAYIAYTATPFANLLIDPQDPEGLYPRDFVVSMPRPSGYFGAEELFGSYSDPEEAGPDMVRAISVAEATLARPPQALGAVQAWHPTAGEELGRAVAWFLLSTAAKRARLGDDVHSTMLVHSSMLASAHFRTRDAIQVVLTGLTQGIVGRQAGVLDALRRQWESESSRVPAHLYDNSPIEWDAVLTRLPAVAERVTLVVDNYRSGDRLSYSTGRPATAIVIGGNTLSRGLTLEGLTTSYFVRAATAYDTLLQMGRWFGYRDGYEDLCRIWMTDELARWFRDLSGVEQEIRDEIAKYAIEGISPLEMGVRIRLHPDLAITAKAKVRDAVQLTLSTSYSGRSPQTVQFDHRQRKTLGDNLRAVRDLADGIVRAGGELTEFRSGSSLRGRLSGFRDVPVDLILQFLQRYRFYPERPELSSALLDRYIRTELKSDSLERWRVVFMAGPSGEEVEIPGVGAIRSVIRSRLKGEGEWANVKALMSAEDRIAGLDWEDGEVALKGPALMALRESRLAREGILRVYLIDRVSDPDDVPGDREPLDAVDVVAGIAIDFPEAAGAHEILEYMVADVPGFADAEEPDDVSAADDEDESDASR